MRKLLLLMLSLCMCMGLAQAQNNDEQDVFNDLNQNEKENVDSTGDQGDPSDAVKKPAPKPFVKITLPIDTLTQLITYREIVEQPESLADSLYKRARRWVLANFTKPGEKPKDMFVMDKPDKIIVNGYMDAYIYSNKYSKQGMGYHRFQMTIWIQEGRYKYKITNLVNESKPYDERDKELPSRTYLEYFTTTLINPKGADALLRGANKSIELLVKSLKKEMRDPVVVEEDEW